MIFQVQGENLILEGKTPLVFALSDKPFVLHIGNLFLPKGPSIKDVSSEGEGGRYEKSQIGETLKT